MEKTLIRWTLLLLTLVFISCQKEESEPGPQGPAGPIGPQGLQGLQGATGPQGPIGMSGNANVMQYNYGSQNFALGYKILQVVTTLDTMERCAWFVYLYYQPLARWYQIPGFAYNAATNYRLSMGHVSGKVHIYIDREGPGETYTKAKVIRVYANNIITGGRVSNQLPDIDFSDYEAVKKYYNLID